MSPKMELANCSMRLLNKEASWLDTYDELLLEKYINPDSFFDACDTTLDSKGDFSTYLDLPSSFSESGSDFARTGTPPRYPLQATPELGFGGTARASSSRYPSSNFTSIDGSISPHALSACSPPLPAPTSSPVDFDFGFDSTLDYDLATALSHGFRSSLDFSDRKSVNLPSSPKMAQPSCSRPGHHESWSQRLEGNAEKYDINPQAIRAEPPSPPKSTRTSLSTSDQNEQVKMPNFSHPFQTPITPHIDTFDPQHTAISTYDSSMSPHNQGQRGSSSSHHRSGSGSYYQPQHSSHPNTPYLEQPFNFEESAGNFTSPQSEQGIPWAQQPQQPQWQANYMDLHQQQQQQWQQQPVFTPSSPSYPMAASSSAQRRVVQPQYQTVPESSYSPSFGSMGTSGLMIGGMQHSQLAQRSQLTLDRAATAMPYQAQLGQQHVSQQYSSSMPQPNQLQRYRSAPSMNPRDVQSRRHRSTGTRSPSPNVASSGSTSQRATSISAGSTSAATTVGNRVSRRAVSTSASRGSGHHRRSKTTGSTPRSASSGVGFVNFTPDDSRKILTGVAPSGSSKTKARREREAQLKEQKMSERYRKAIMDAGGDASALEFQEDQEESSE